MLEVNAPVVPERKAMFVPLEALGRAKSFNGTSINVRDFKQHKLSCVGDKDYVILPWDLDSLRKLALHDIFVPGPIRYEYHWPSKYPRPLDHQVVTADFLTQNPRAFLFNSIGTSKTLSALWAADYLMRKGEIKKVLIVSPLSTLDRVWDLEIFCNLFGRTKTIVHGSREKRLKELAKDVDYYIINHDGLKTLESELVAAEFDLVIVDEGAVFRNQKTALWRACYNVCGLQTNRWLWWMTGSPMPNAPTDVWAQAKIVRPDTVPRYFTRFRSQVMVQLSQYKWVPIKGYEQTVYDTLRPVIRYTRDVCDLPADYVRDLPCEMSPAQAKAYEHMANSLVVEIDSEVITAVNEGVKLGKLLQIACGAIYTRDKEVMHLNPEPKFEQLDETFEFSERKLIVFAPFKYCLPMIAERYRAQGVKVATVSGDTPVKARAGIFADFQEGDLEMIVAHPKCMAHGLTLTRSNVIVWWAPVDDYDIYEQACGRIKRPGQTKEQFVVHLSSSKVETEVYRRLRTKEKIQGLVLELFKKTA